MRRKKRKGGKLCPSSNFQQLASVLKSKFLTLNIVAVIPVIISIMSLSLSLLVGTQSVSVEDSDV